MNGLARPITAMELEGVTPASIDGGIPTFKMVDPKTLYVDDSYQRGLTDASLALIRKIVSEWSWARFKPPIVAIGEHGFEVIDGQHTAIAAASHPDITEIPVFVVSADTTAQKAGAFVGHNRDRLRITALQLYYSAVAAGDEDALTIQQVCARCGIRILRSPPASGGFKPRDTMAIQAIGALISRRGAMGGRKVLEVLANAECEPVSANLIRAIEFLFYDAGYKGTVLGEDLTQTIVRIPPDQLEREAKVFAAAHKLPAWRGYAVFIYRNTRKRRAVE